MPLSPDFRLRDFYTWRINDGQLSDYSNLNFEPSTQVLIAGYQDPKKTKVTFNTQIPSQHLNTYSHFDTVVLNPAKTWLPAGSVAQLTVS